MKSVSHIFGLTYKVLASTIFSFRFPGDIKSVKIPLKIDALGYAPNSMKICDLMEILKGSVQRQIHEMARSVLSEFKMRGTVSVPQAFHLYPRPFGHFATIIYTKTGTCAAFGE